MRRSPGLNRCLLLLAFPAVAILLSFTTVYAAGAPAKSDAVPLNIQGKSAKRTLAVLERKFHVDVQFMPADVADKTSTHAVRATLSLEQALKAMLDKSGLDFRICPASVVVVGTKDRVSSCPARPAAKAREKDSSTPPAASSRGVTAVIAVASTIQFVLALMFAWVLFEYLAARKRSRVMDRSSTGSAFERGYLRARGRQSIHEGDLDFATHKLIYLFGGTVLAECAAIGALRDVTFDPAHLPLAVWSALVLIGTAARDIARRAAKLKETALLQLADIGDDGRRDEAIVRLAAIHASKTFFPDPRRRSQGNHAPGRRTGRPANREDAPAPSTDPN